MAHRGCGASSRSAMLRIHGDRTSLLAALAASWAESQLAIPPQVLGGGLQEGHQDRDQQDVVAQIGIEGLITGITGVRENLLQGHPDQRRLTCASR